MNANEVRLMYKNDTADEKPYMEGIANKQYVEWLEEKICDLYEQEETINLK